MAEISPVHSLKEKDEAVEHVPVEDPDAEFGGKEERRRIERKLLWKLDCRMSIMIVIYILNYVSPIWCFTDINMKSMSWIISCVCAYLNLDR